jgi:class 3 adenylate cyclase
VALRTENLAVMLTDMKGFTAATRRQSRAENARMLALLDELVIPVVRAFRGRRVKTIGDAYLVLFDSPTAALLCGTALQDRLWDHGRRVRPDEQIEVKVVVSLGEVRLVGGGEVPRDVYGEAVNLAARVEAEASAGEVWFTEAVRLVADPAQIPAEDLGARTLKGIGEEVRLYRVRRSADGEGGAPYANAALSRVLGVPPPEPAVLARAIRRRASPLFAAWRAAAELLAVVPLRGAAALVLALALAAGAWRWWDGTVERQIARGDWPGAERAIAARAATHGDADPKVLFLKGCLAEARASAGHGALRDAFALWTRAAVAGSGAALDALDAQGEAWECDRRRLAARALADTRSPAALRALRRLDEREPAARDAYGRVRHLLGADGQCGAGDIARDAIRRIEGERR